MISPVKSCFLDPIPIWFMKQNSNVFVPVITDIINRSLISGTFQDALKHAIITLLIKKKKRKKEKKRKIHTSRKNIEKFVINNVNRYIEVNGLGEELQSAYRSKPLGKRLTMIL